MPLYFWVALLLLMLTGVAGVAGLIVVLVIVWRKKQPPHGAGVNTRQ